MNHWGLVSCTTARHSLSHVRPLAWNLTPLVLLAFITLLLTGTEICKGDITGDAPPSSGDWIVGNDTRVIDMTLDIHGDISISANLTIEGSSVRLHPTSVGADGITVTSSGHLAVNDSTISSASPHRFTFTIGGPTTLVRTDVSDVEDGIRVLTDETVDISECRILDFSGQGLYLENANATRVEDVLLQTDGLTAGWTSRVTTDAANDDPVLYAPGPGIVFVASGSPVLDGIEVSVNGTLTIDLTVDNRATRPSVTVDMFWPIIRSSTGDPLSIDGLRTRDSTLGFEVNVYMMNAVSGARLTLTTNGVICAVALDDYRNVTVGGLSMTRIYKAGILVNVTTTDQTLGDLSLSRRLVGDRLVHARVTGTVSTKGPHRYQLTLRDSRAHYAQVLRVHFEPVNVGTQSPTFLNRVLVDNVTAKGCWDLIEIMIAPVSSVQVSVVPRHTVSNCTFSLVSGYIVSFRDQTTVDNCTIRQSNGGDLGLVRSTLTGWGDADGNITATLRGNLFEENTGRIVTIHGTLSMDDGADLLDNTFSNNTCLNETAMMYFSLVTHLNIEGNTIEDTTYFRSIQIMDPGGYRDPDGRVWRLPCTIVVGNNTFTRNRDQGSGPRCAFIEALWGGDLFVSHNVVSHTRTIVMQLTEVTDYCWFSNLHFHHNDVQHNKMTVLQFNQLSRGHMKLEAFIHDNVIHNNSGRFTDHPIPSPIRDYGARFKFMDNTVTNNTGVVFVAFGNITASGNTFVDCSDYGIQLRYLRVHQPWVTNNTFIRCGNAIWLEGKRNAPIQVLAWLGNNDIDCNGTAVYFNWMEVTMSNSSISDNARRAVVADISKVDAYNCHFDADTSSVIVDGYIRMRYWVEAWVEWADARGTPSGRLAPGASVTFDDVSGTWGATVHTDGVGRTPRIDLMAWHIEHSTPPVHWTPFTVRVNVSSIVNITTLDLDRSYFGASALWLLLWDPYLPVIHIDSPMEGDLVNVTDIPVKGFASDIGSGLFIIEMAMEGGEPEIVGRDEFGEFSAMLTGLPEGRVSIHLTATDAAGNTFTHRVTITVDRTPPRLEVLEPPDGLVTTGLSVLIRGETEVDATVTVNIVDVPTYSGLFSVELPLIEGGNIYVIVAEDAAGNRAIISLRLTRDTMPPDLELFWPLEGLRTASHVVLVKGRIMNYTEAYVDVLRSRTDILGEPIVEEGNGYFTHEARLEEGTNTIFVVVRDAAGNTEVLIRRVEADWTPPSVEILSPEDGTLLADRRLTVSLEVSADADQVYANGRRVLGTGVRDCTLFLGEGENVIVAQVLDVLGNEANVSIMVTVDTTRPDLVIIEPIADELRLNDPWITFIGATEGPRVVVTIMGQQAEVDGDGMFNHTLDLGQDGVHRVLLSATDEAGNSNVKYITVHLSTAAPEIWVNYDPPGSVIFQDIIEVRGMVGDGGGTLVIRHSSVEEGKEFTIPLAGSTFTHFLVLRDGKNTIVVGYTDTFGNGNSTEPHTVEVRERDVEETTVGVELWVLAAIVGATCVLVAAFAIIRWRGERE